jgi:type 1 glutamine amidotransferase
MSPTLRVLLAAAVLTGFVSTAPAADKRILLIAGKPSHGPGDHEFRAGSLLLKKCLDGVTGIRAEVHDMGWPKDERVLEGADAVLIYADGGAGHPALQPGRAQVLNGLVKRGAGIGCAHYGVEVPKGDPGALMHEWIGGHYEHQFSVNPMWKPEFNSFPNHPVARGVKPFAVVDEWYFNMRWRPDMKGVTPILVAKPSDAVRDGPYVYPRGPYPHIQEAKGRDETMMWVYERPGGGRGFGFTGGHKHANWGNEDFRKVVLNALLWIAKADVPKNGVESSLTEEDLKANLDPKGQKK